MYNSEITATPPPFDRNEYGSTGTTPVSIESGMTN